jgi:ribosomal protein L11 methyltransferase
MNYYAYRLTNDAELNDILVALLAEAPFDTFEEKEDGLIAYLPADKDYETEAEALLEDLAEQFELSWERTYIKGENWNEIWESNFQPVVVRDFCAVRADFHEPIAGVQHELVINPKMAFGTGHHETTWMCMSQMQTLNIAGKSLLDYGCGTGVLAILAARLGAVHIEAVDIESESYQNTIDNSQINHTPQVVARLGDITAVQGTEFDGILANINRHIILDSLPQLSRMTKPGGWLLLSGILLQDEQIVVEAAQAVGFELVELNKRGNWLCIHMAKALEHV